MANDPQLQERQRRMRLFMLLMMIPYLWLWFTMSNKQKALQQEQALREATPVAAVAEVDPEKQVDEQVRDLEALIAQDPKSEQAQRYRLMVAVAYEQAGFYQKAYDHYAKFGGEFRGSPYTAHASFQAGRIARDHLQDEKLFVKHLGRLGNIYNQAVWDPHGDGDPNAKFAAAEVAARELDPVYQKGILYRLLDGLVGVFNPAAHPEYAYACGLILLGLLARLLLWPLTAWGYKAGKIMGAKMKVIQPQIAELKERHKDDQLKVMQKQQALMKQYGISMRSGCISSLLQMAVLIPVYNAVRHYAYPLGQGSFLWIETLQRPDTILLVCYTLSFVVSMKLQPQQPSADPQQQKTQQMMTYMMPIMFFFMMQQVPSAFILYWTIFLFFSTFQTLLFARQWERGGGDAAVIASLPPELQPKPEKARRETPEARRGAGKSSAAAASRAKPVAGTVVERTGEEIAVEGAGVKKESFLSRLFAPALNGRPESGADAEASAAREANKNQAPSGDGKARTGSGRPKSGAKS